MKDFIREWIDKNREREDRRAAERYVQQQMDNAVHAFETHVIRQWLKERG